MRMELEVIADILQKSKKTTKELIYKKEFELDSIFLEQYIDNKGKIINKYCGVIDGEKYYKVNHPYNYLRAFTTPIVVKGLMSKSKSYGKDTKNKKV